MGTTYPIEWDMPYQVLIRGTESVVVIYSKSDNEYKAEVEV
jgi:hypothetical protein